MNARMNQRVSKLEESSSMNDANLQPTRVIIVRLTADDKKEEYIRLSGKGIAVDRLPDEDMGAFGTRAEALIRQQHPEAGPVLLMFAGYEDEGSENPSSDSSDNQINIQQKGINHA